MDLAIGNRVEGWAGPSPALRAAVALAACEALATPGAAATAALARALGQAVDADALAILGPDAEAPALWRASPAGWACDAFDAAVAAALAALAGGGAAPAEAVVVPAPDPSGGGAAGWIAAFHRRRRHAAADVAAALAPAAPVAGALLAAGAAQRARRAAEARAAALAEAAGSAGAGGNAARDHAGDAAQGVTRDAGPSGEGDLAHAGYNAQGGAWDARPGREGDAARNGDASNGGACDLRRSGEADVARAGDARHVGKGAAAWPGDFGQGGPRDPDRGGAAAWAWDGACGGAAIGALAGPGADQAGPLPAAPGDGGGCAPAPEGADWMGAPAALAAGLRLPAGVADLAVGVATFDAADRLALHNARFRELYPDMEGALRPGASYAEICAASPARVVGAPADLDAIAMLSRRLALHAAPGDPFLVETPQGRIVMVAETRGGDGGVICVHVDLTGLTERQARLAAERRRAETALASRARFLAELSHELRTPLNAVIGFADLIAAQAGGAPDGRVRGHAETIRTSGRHALSLIVDVLDMSRIEAGGMDADCAAVDAAAAIADACAMLAHQADAKGLRLSVETPATLPKVWAERRRLVQIVQNLLSNAVKFTAAGEVRVSAAVEGDALRIAVADTGRGMTGPEIDMALTPFRQVARSDGVAGSGLGLPLARTLAELQGGALEIASAPGRGTTAVVTLPLAP